MLFLSYHSNLNTKPNFFQMTFTPIITAFQLWKDIPSVSTSAITNLNRKALERFRFSDSLESIRHQNSKTRFVISWPCMLMKTSYFTYSHRQKGFQSHMVLSLLPPVSQQILTHSFPRNRNFVVPTTVTHSNHDEVQPSKAEETHIMIKRSPPPPIYVQLTTFFPLGQTPVLDWAEERKDALDPVSVCQSFRLSVSFFYHRRRPIGFGTHCANMSEACGLFHFRAGLRHRLEL